MLASGLARWFAASDSGALRTPTAFGGAIRAELEVPAAMWALKSIGFVLPAGLSVGPNRTASRPRGPYSSKCQHEPTLTAEPPTLMTCTPMPFADAAAVMSSRPGCPYHWKVARWLTIAASTIASEV